MEFTNLRNAAIAEIVKDHERILDSIRDNTKENHEWVVESLLTPLMEKKFKRGEITESHAIEKAIKKAEKNKKEKIEKTLVKVAETETAIPFQSLVITVEWKKNRTWGNNPTATVRTDQYHVTTGTASGCGYDKESAAVAQALNALPEVMTVLYSAKNSTMGSNREILGYGSGYWSLPNFEGGVGISCFRSIFEKLGYTWEHVSWTDTTDVYKVYK